MGNCIDLNKKPYSYSGVTPSELLRSPPSVRLYGPSDCLIVCYLRFALSFKPVSVEFVVTQSLPVLQFGEEETVSGSVETMLGYVESRFPEPRLLRFCDEKVPPVVEASILHHRSMAWHVERLSRWVDDLAARGGSKATGNLVTGTPQMEIKKFGRSYSQLLEVMLEHAQMEERAVFPILERAGRGLCKVANEEHARDLPIMNGIREDIKSIGVLNSGNYAYQEALSSVSTRLKTLQDNCKAHFEEEEICLFPLIKALELSKEQHQKVLEQCFDTMQSTHSHLFRFFIEGLLPHDALHYLDLVIKSSDRVRTASILRMITQ